MGEEEEGENFQGIDVQSWAPYRTLHFIFAPGVIGNGVL